MTIEECYEKLGGDFGQVCSRLPGRSFVERFFIRYLEDDSAELLSAAVQRGDAEEALRLAIALKGLTANLGFGRLERSCERLILLLRSGCGAITPEAVFLTEAIHRHHREAAEILQMYLIENRV